MNHLRQKSSHSEYHLNGICKHSGSLNDIHSINNNQLRYGRYSVCDCSHKKSSFITNKQQKSTNVTYQKTKSKPKDLYCRLNRERCLFPLNMNPSSSTSTNNYNRRQSIHYVTCKRENNQPKLSGQQSLSSTTTTTSNLTRSTVTASSESSFLVDQNKIIRKLSNNTKPTNCSYQK